MLMPVNNSLENDFGYFIKIESFYPVDLAFQFLETIVCLYMMIE